MNGIRRSSTRLVCTLIFRYAGINQVTVANNHFLDYGETGANSTLREFFKRKLKVSGFEIGDIEYRKPQVSSST